VISFFVPALDYLENGHLSFPNMAERKQETLEHLNVSQLLNATKGFDHLFTDDIGAARKHFELNDDPFHLLGLGVCAFLEAALGMEVCLTQNFMHDTYSLVTSLG